MTSSLTVTTLAIHDAFGMTKSCRKAAHQPQEAPAPLPAVDPVTPAVANHFAPAPPPPFQNPAFSLPHSFW